MSKVTEIKFYCDNEECGKEITDTRIDLAHIIIEHKGEVVHVNDDRDLDGMEFCSLKCLTETLQKMMFKLESIS